MIWGGGGRITRKILFEWFDLGGGGGGGGGGKVQKGGA